MGGDSGAGPGLGFSLSQIAGMSTTPGCNNTGKLLKCFVELRIVEGI